MPRHSLAIAWDKWAESDEGQGCLSDQSSSPLKNPYLENRLRRAFNAGAQAQESIATDTQKEGE